ncbi:MAG: DUF2283 domain-containing protein [Patescibacteria group bacterium]|nr:DUF2283 domain-containing protein [Patescibacteria group bacterium]
MAKIKYDPGVQIPSIRLSDKKSVDSDVQDNVVLDYDADGQLVNIEVMEASFSEVVKQAVDYSLKSLSIKQC